MYILYFEMMIILLMRCVLYTYYASKLKLIKNYIFNSKSIMRYYSQRLWRQ